MPEGIRVLYVDDEPDLLEITKLFLEESGEFFVETSPSAQEALDSPAFRSCDVIVADFQMPGMDGIAFLKETRKRLGNLPFILFTGRGREEVVIDAINNGVDFYLQKGGDPESQFAELAHKIRQAVTRRRNEEILRESEAKYRDLADLLPQMVFETDPDLRLTYANRHALAVFGLTDRDLEHGSNVLSFIDPSQHAGVKDSIQKSLAGISFEPGEYTALRKDGSTFPVVVYASPVYRNKTHAGFRGVVIDISARKKMEDGLRESESKFRSIFENSPYPIAINSLPDNKFLEINKAFLEVSGYTEAEILGKDPVGMGLLPLAEVVRLVSHRVLTGKIENVPLALTAKAGKRVHVVFSTLPVTINDKPALVTVTSEITKLKRVEEDLLQKNEDLHAAYEELTATEEELRQNYEELSKKEAVLRANEEKFRALVELSLDGIMIADFSGNLLFVNRAAGRIVDIADYEAVAGKRNVMEFIAPGSQAEVLRDFSNVAQGTDTYLASYKIITDTKREAWIESIGKKIPFGDTTAVLISIRDVTERKEADERMRDSENKFATVFRSSPVALTLVSATDGTFVDVNDAFLRSTGYARHEVVGCMSAALGIFADRTEYKLFSTTLRNQGTVHGMEMKCRIKSGEIRTCRFSSGIITMGGKPHIISTVEDITESKATELAIQALVRSMVGTTGLDALKKITENVSSWLGADSVMIGEIQPDGQTVKVLSMLLDGKEVDGFSYTLKGTPCEDVAEKGFCLIPDNAIQIFPGSRDLVELNIHGYLGTPLWNSEGKVFGILCALSRNPLTPPRTVQEIIEIIAVKAAAEIERVQMERTLRESRYRLAEAMDMANLVNWEYDAATGMFTLDDRFYALYGTTAEREGGTLMPADVYAREFVHPEDRAMVAREVEKALNAADAQYISHVEHRIIRRDGAIRYIVVRIGITKDAEGRTIKTHGANQDITDRKRDEEALRQANKKLNLLSGINRHDIRNQLMTLNGFVSLLHKKIPDPQYNEYFSRITAASSQVRNLIEFTREYEQIGVQAPTWQEVRTLVDHAGKEGIPEQIALINDLPAGADIYADPLIAKVFFNLVDNAVRHGGKITTIRFSSEERNGDRIIVCEDDGEGIVPEEKDLIFDLGFGKNTGFGLAISREILDITGITIKETGEAGKGARFEITVPGGQYRSAP